MSQLKRRALREDLVLQASLEAYAAIRHDGRLADRALDFVLRGKKHLYSQERRAVAERVYLLLRRQRLVDELLDRATRRRPMPTTQKDVWRLAVARVLDGEAPSVVAEGSGFAGAEMKPLLELDRARDELGTLPEAQRFAVEASLPDFLAREFLRQLGAERAWAEAAAMNQRAPLVVRTNTLKTTRDRLARILDKEGVEAAPTPLSPLGLTLDTRLNVFGLSSFRDGLYEIQDEGSQLLGMLVDAPPTRVVDACAGAGGKTLQLAAQMKNRGDLHALDVEERRLADLKLRARRAGVHNARVKVIPADDSADKVLAPLAGSMDRVFVDAPCSGSGTFRRKPDARYRLDEAMLADHVRRQHQLLQRFAVMVKPGGRLVYGTCSLLEQENEAVIDAFLERNPGYRRADASAWVPEAAVTGGVLKVSPAAHGTDGFFGAVLVREPRKG